MLEKEKRNKQLSTQSFQDAPPLLSKTFTPLLPFHPGWNMTLYLFQAFPLISLIQVTHPTLWIHNEHTEAGTADDSADYLFMFKGGGAQLFPFFCWRISLLFFFKQREVVKLTRCGGGYTCKPMIL